jgi:hypothetical protein
LPTRRGSDSPIVADAAALRIIGLALGAAAGAVTLLAVTSVVTNLGAS